MKQLIADFPNHLSDALALVEASNWRNPAKRFKAVLITGLGGSGIGGSIVAEWMAPYARTPILVNKDYSLPAFVDADTLVLASSYSGNTEETLSALEEAIHKGAEVAVITSGGKTAELAKTHQLNSLLVPGGNPPRSMLGYSLTGLMAFMEFYGLNAPEYKSAWHEAINHMKSSADKIHHDAKAAAEILYQTYPVVYTTNGLAAMGERFRQQYNENSKMLGWSSAIPEMNHNELVGWAGGSSAFSVVLMRSSFEHPRNAIRANINKDILLKKTNKIVEWQAEGSSLMAQSLYLNHLGDWTSYYLSEMNQVDIMDIKVIDFLKDALSKV